jgi:hypothetical protein
MAKKAIVKLLEAAMKGKSEEAVVEALAISADEFGLLIDGSMEFSPLLAKKFGEVLEIEPRTILAAQADDQLNTLGVPAKELEKVEVKTTRAKGTGTDGRPSQSPMHRERRMISITLPSDVPAAQANKTVRAVMASFAD